MIGAQGHIVSSHDKAPVLPKKEWPTKAREVTIDAAIDAYRLWGNLVRGVGIVAYDSLAVLDFDPIEKTVNVEPEKYEERKAWREKMIPKLMQATYCERSRSGRGLHFIFRTKRHFSGERGISALATHYAIDFLTGMKYCDITADWVNDLPAVDGTELLEQLIEKVRIAHPDESGSGNNSGIVGTYSFEALTEIMSHLDPNQFDYNGWIYVGICLWQETLGTNMGLAVWDNWSKRSHKYCQTLTPHSRWVTFKPTGIEKGTSVGIGHVIRLAEKSGANIAAIRLKHAAPISEAAKTMTWNEK